MRIALDIDGVFADWQVAFMEVMHTVNGNLVYTTAEKKRWGVDASTEDYNKTWDIISDERMNWWMTLPSLVSYSEVMLVNNITSNVENTVYFLTSRKTLHQGLPADIQSEGWLAGIGVHNPRVILTKSSGKAELLNALDIDFFLDDKPKILEDAVKNCPDTLVSARNWCYNEGVEVDARYDSVGEALIHWTT